MLYSAIFQPTRLEISGTVKFRQIIVLILLLAWIWAACGCVSHGRIGVIDIDISGRMRPSPGDELILISWNIAKNVTDNPEIMRLVDDHDPDILFIQEGISTTCELFGTSFHQCLFAPSWEKIDPDGFTGVQMLSRYHLVDPVHVPSPGLEGFWFTPKASMITTLDLADGRRLMLINVHMLNFVPLGRLEAYLEAVYAHAGKHEGPLIAVGDFNTWNSPRLKAVQQFAAKLGMVEALAYHETGGTPSAWFFVFKPFMQLDLDAPMDRWFCRGVEVLSCRRLGGFVSSNHVPVLLQVRVLPP
ncbi:MAG: hypothetical protein C4548_05090 [Desulfobacteraceae bacterium]|nr:MAG: hypothetical protein C4548_05090 [Desulfobacteraceae bacterium]